MKTFKFWVRAAIVIAVITGIVWIIAFVIFQVIYGWRIEAVSPLEEYIRTIIARGFKGAWLCAVLALCRVLMMVYDGEILTKSSISGPKESLNSPDIYGPLVKRIKLIKLIIRGRGDELGYDAYIRLASYAISVLESKNLPIPEKDEDLWKLIEPKVRQYDKIEYPKEPSADCPNGHPKFSIRHRLKCILRDHGNTGEYDLESLYSLCQISLNGAELSTYSDAELWAVLKPLVEAMDSEGPRLSEEHLAEAFAGGPCKVDTDNLESVRDQLIKD